MVILLDVGFVVCPWRSGSASPSSGEGCRFDPDLGVTGWATLKLAIFPKEMTLFFKLFDLSWGQAILARDASG